MVLQENQGEVRLLSKWVVCSLFIYQFTLSLNIIYGFTESGPQILKCCRLVSDADHCAEIFPNFIQIKELYFSKKVREKLIGIFPVWQNYMFFFLGLFHRNS